MKDLKGFRDLENSVHAVLLFTDFGLSQCASKINGGQFSSSKEYPDEVLRFVRSHPLMFQAVQPVHRRPVLLDTEGGRKLTQLAVDRVEAEDGHYNVLFIGTGIQL